MQPLNSTCPHCGTAFECGIAARRDDCWCFSLPAVTPADGAKRCFCPECLKKMADNAKEQQESRS